MKVLIGVDGATAGNLENNQSKRKKLSFPWDPEPCSMIAFEDIHL